MVRFVSMAVAAGFLAAAATAATAQSGSGLAGSPAGSAGSGSVSSTVTGAPPETTGSTTAVGQTKPPGAAVGDQMGTNSELEKQSRQLDRQIKTGICQGC